MTTSVKTCFKCNITKPLSEFYRHSKMADKHLNKCKDCAKNDTNSNRNNNLEYYQEYDKKRYRTDLTRKQKIRDCYDSKVNKSPAMRKATIAVNNAIRDGRLQKKPCEICGNIKAEAHHDDYAFPFRVTWLCRSHHVKWHLKNGSGKNANIEIEKMNFDIGDNYA